MKNKILIVLTIILVVICSLLATFFKGKKTINYTFAININDQVYLYDSNGNTINNDSLVYSEDLKDDYNLIVNKNKECAIVDKLGNIIIDFNEYDNIEEYGKLYLAYKSDNISLITGDNKIVRKIESTKELVSRIIHNYAVLLYDNIYYVYNSKGEIIFSRDYIKKKSLSLKETENYGFINYNGSEFLFEINSSQYEERKSKKVAKIEENNEILLVSGQNNRIYYKGELKNKDFICENPVIDESSRVMCNDEVLYENDDLKNIGNHNKIIKNDDYYVICDKKCSLYKEKLVLNGYDDIIVLKTNMKYYFEVKKGNNTIILNDDLKPIFSTKKNVKTEENHLEIDNKIYTFEGNEIKL